MSNQPVTLKLSNGISLIPYTAANKLGAVVVEIAGIAQDLLLIVPQGEHTITVGKKTLDAAGTVRGYKVTKLTGKCSAVPKVATETFTVNVTSNYAVFLMKTRNPDTGPGFPSTKPKPILA